MDNIQTTIGIVTILIFVIIVGGVMLVAEKIVGKIEETE